MANSSRISPIAVSQSVADADELAQKYAGPTATRASESSTAISPTANDVDAVGTKYAGKDISGCPVPVQPETTKAQNERATYRMDYRRSVRVPRMVSGGPAEMWRAGKSDGMSVVCQ